MSNVASNVNQLVANQGVLYVKLHQYHWYVQGPDFYTLHEKFEELYDETTESFDLFAERLLAIGEKPYSTLGEFLEHASIKEKPYDKKMSAEDMVRDTMADYQTMKELAQRGAELAGESGDAVTEDMLIEYIEGIDLTLWMFHAFLDEDVK